MDRIDYLSHGTQQYGSHSEVTSLGASTFSLRLDRRLLITLFMLKVFRIPRISKTVEYQGHARI